MQFPRLRIFFETIHVYVAVLIVKFVCEINKI